MAYWLMKSEPDELSIKGLEKLGKARWDGVRNYQARNFLRAMAVGDEFFFYHSSCPEPGIAGIGRIIEAAYPDPTALEPESEYFDPKATAEKNAWSAIDVEHVHNHLLHYLSGVSHSPDQFGRLRFFDGTLGFGEALGAADH